LFLYSAPAARALAVFGPNPSAPLLRESSSVCAGRQTEPVAILIFFVWSPVARQSGLVPESRARVRALVSSVPCRVLFDSRLAATAPARVELLLFACSVCAQDRGRRPSLAFDFFHRFSNTYESCVWFVGGAHTGCVLEPSDQMTRVFLL
jgi:hypothetical protein